MKWEYKVVTVAPNQAPEAFGWVCKDKKPQIEGTKESILNHFGNEGWELVSFVPSGIHVAWGPVVANLYTATFKRPVSTAGSK